MNTKKDTKVSIQTKTNLAMEVINHTAKKKDTNLLMVTHLLQLATVVTGFGGLIAPLIVWATKKDDIQGMDYHGKTIINFQISIILLALVSIPLIFALGLGILMLIVIGVVSIVLPIINALRANNGEDPLLWLTFEFLKY